MRLQVVSCTGSNLIHFFSCTKFGAFWIFIDLQLGCSNRWNLDDIVIEAVSGKLFVSATRYVVVRIAQKRSALSALMQLVACSATHNSFGIKDSQ